MNQQGDRYYRVVILGGGTAGWMTAAALARRLPDDAYAITLVESDAIGTVGVGEATLPHIKAFNDMLGLDEAAFIRATRATFKLGVEFRDWHRPGDRYLHPFGAFGEPWGGVQFQHHWLRLRAAGRDVAPFQSYSFACAAARADAFDFPTEDTTSVRSTYAYAYHFDSTLYAAHLRDWATARGVNRVEGRVETVEQNPETGAIAALRLQSGARIAGELFVDCSGFRSLLLGETLGVGWEDWRHWLPCDRALAVGCDHLAGGGLTPYTRATARPLGWQWRIALQHRIGNGFIFSSDFASEEEVRPALLAALDGAAQAAGLALNDASVTAVASGRRREAWTGNCVRIGGAACALDPVLDLDLHLVQLGIVHLLALFPAGQDHAAERAEYNRITASLFDRLRDFQAATYALALPERRPTTIPDSLMHRLETFSARGMITTMEDESFPDDQWRALLVGLGVTPESWPPALDATPSDRLKRGFRHILGFVREKVLAQPSHDTCLAELGARKGA